MNNYIKEAERQLNDKNNYHILTQDPVLGNNTLENQEIDRFKIADYLKTSDPRTPRFYSAPKIHKPGNPSLPVVTSVNCHTASISKYIG